LRVSRTHAGTKDSLRRGTGELWELTHRLSSSDRYGELCHYFCMLLSKVETLTKHLLVAGTSLVHVHFFGRKNFVNGLNY
jgi:hypothetical protein